MITFQVAVMNYKDEATENILIIAKQDYEKLSVLDYNIYVNLELNSFIIIL